MPGREAGGLYADYRLLAKLYEEAGVPAGLLNVVVGDVAAIGDRFTLHSTPKLISMTG